MVKYTKTLKRGGGSEGCLGVDEEIEVALFVTVLLVQAPEQFTRGADLLLGLPDLGEHEDGLLVLSLCNYPALELLDAHAARDQHLLVEDPCQPQQDHVGVAEYNGTYFSLTESLRELRRLLLFISIYYY